MWHTFILRIAMSTSDASKAAPPHLVDVNPARCPLQGQSLENTQGVGTGRRIGVGHRNWCVEGPVRTIRLPKVGIVQVDPAGLQSLSEQVENFARELVEATSPEAVANPWQPSSRAVDLVNGRVSSAALALARMSSSMAEKLSASSMGYKSRDDDAASRIHFIDL